MQSISLAAPYDISKWFEYGTAGVEMGDSPAMRAVRTYLASRTFNWVIILGSEGHGCGKSLAAEWLRTSLLELATNGDADVLELKRRGDLVAPLWCNCAQMKDLAALSPWDREKQIDRLRKSWVVVLDDLGTEPKDVDLPGVLQTRQGSRLLTIITHNLVEAKDTKNAAGETVPNPRYGKMSSEWRSRYDGRIGSRLRTPGDSERGTLDAWCHVPSVDLRDRMTPRLLPQPAPLQGKHVSQCDLDALMEPLRRQMKEGKDEPEKEQARLVAESLDLRNMMRRKVLAELVLKEVEARVAAGDVAAELLIERARRRMDS